MIHLWRLAIATTLLMCQNGILAQSLVQPKPVVAQVGSISSAEGTPEPLIVIPVGTTVRTSLKSPLNTVSARAGSGIYLETTADVIQQNRIVIPAKSWVQGAIEKQERPGRVKGRGQLQFHLTTLILPNNYTVAIAGSLQSLPGSHLYENRGREGAIQPVDQIDKDAATIVSSVAAGAAIGALTHGDFRAGRGALIGAGFGLGKVLFKRGDDVHLPEGTAVEMVLDHPVAIPVRELASYALRSEVPVAKPPASTTPMEQKRSLFPDSADLAILPGGTPLVRFHR